MISNNSILLRKKKSEVTGLLPHSVWLLRKGQMLIMPLFSASRALHFQVVLKPTRRLIEKRLFVFSRVFFKKRERKFILTFWAGIYKSVGSSDERSQAHS
jgi:hypothetical protein